MTDEQADAIIEALDRLTAAIERNGQHLTDALDCLQAPLDIIVETLPLLARGDIP